MTKKLKKEIPQKGQTLRENKEVFLDYKKIIDEGHVKNKKDARAYEKADDDLCMLCGAKGQDKRTLLMRCFYEIREMVPEALNLAEVKEYKDKDMDSFYFLRICKCCRAKFLGHIKDWREETVALRGKMKDYDGYIDEDDREEDPERNIPIRENGIIKMINIEEWNLRQHKKR